MYQASRCSEEKPNCSACARRGVSCNYPPLVHNKVAVSPVPSTSPSTQNVTILTSTSHLTTTDHPCSQQHSPFTSSTSVAPASIASPAPSRSDVLFNLHDMTLLHHWTASTSQQHHIRSLQGFHTAVSQCRNDIEQGSSVFLWSLLNMFYVFLTLGRLGRNSDICIEDHRDRVLGTVWIRLIRGIKSVIEDNRPAIESDNFNAIVSIGNWRSLDPNKSMGKKQRKKTYDEALDVLRRYHALVTQFETTDIELTNQWPSYKKESGSLLFIFVVPSHYFKLLQQRQPAALMLFSFFGASLHRYRKRG
ncbi:hypothetical protein QL093DRAFT_2639801 [Fusarium oxysporum]|nr:hypothetical protein QL093DRAFT_2639801 [Fusarium oxysporum]